MKDLDRRGRLEMLGYATPSWAGRRLLRHRYLLLALLALLALLINLPGNSLIGGGGISLVAGPSRLFSFPAIILTIALATAPVPLVVYFFGVEFLK